MELSATAVIVGRHFFRVCCPDVSHPSFRVLRDSIGDAWLRFRPQDHRNPQKQPGAEDVQAAQLVSAELVRRHHQPLLDQLRALFLY
jgi:hypothetical protein